MAKRTENDKETKDQLWSQLEKGFASMLRIEGSDQHPQPMSHFADRDAGVIWFITSSQTDLAQAIGNGVDAGMTFISKSQDYHASLKGRLEIVEDDAKLDELWSIPVAAWFEHGREDPSIRLLRFRPAEAAIWASDANRLLVGLKMLRAGTTEGADAPDIGVHRIIEFDSAA